MKTRRKSTGLAVFLLAAMLATLAPACERVPDNVDGYTAVLPAALRAGTTQVIPVSLFNGAAPASGQVMLTLLKDGQPVAAATERVSGAGALKLEVPNIPEGEYQVALSGPGFRDEAKVAVSNSYLVFLETDKPIYKPGQTIHIRVLTLDPDLMPVSDSVTVEALDAKGTKVFRTVSSTDAYGMATMDLPLSTEPNLGAWKVNAATAKNKTQLDVRVEEYVLPKYEVVPDLPREWFLVSEQIKGKVTATYSFGKPVKGDLTIKATRYVGQWQTYSTVTIPIDGQAEFTVPATGYVAGVPAAGGQGNVQLDFAVAEKTTGYTEKTTKLLTVTQSSLVLQSIPSGSIFKPGLPFGFLVVSQTPDKLPVDTRVNARITYFRKDFTTVSAEQKNVNTVKGKALVEITPPKDAVALTIDCSAQGASTTKTIESGYSPTGNFIHLEQTSPAGAEVGQKATFRVYSTSEATNFYYEVLARGSVVFSDFSRGDELSFTLTPAMAPGSKLLVYQVLPNAEIAADYLPFKVAGAYPQEVKVGFTTAQAKPGDAVGVNVTTQGQAKVGIAAVDKSV
ncbi:MAG: hypothetical protein HY675_17310, partial [Chloroflexi bacterium]|nr:hypothetical protein [Chloroflexota bacterium]